MGRQARSSLWTSSSEGPCSRGYEDSTFSAPPPAAKRPSPGRTEGTPAEQRLPATRSRSGQGRGGCGSMGSAPAMEALAEEFLSRSAAHGAPLGQTLHGPGTPGHIARTRGLVLTWDADWGQHAPTAAGAGGCPSPCVVQSVALADRSLVRAQRGWYQEAISPRDLTGPLDGGKEAAEEGLLGHFAPEGPSLAEWEEEEQREREAEAGLHGGAPGVSWSEPLMGRTGGDETDAARQDCRGRGHARAAASGEKVSAPSTKVETSPGSSSPLAAVSLGAEPGHQAGTQGKQRPRSRLARSRGGQGDPEEGAMTQSRGGSREAWASFLEESFRGEASPRSPPHAPVHKGAMASVKPAQPKKPAISRPVPPDNTCGAVSRTLPPRLSPPRREHPRKGPAAPQPRPRPGPGRSPARAGRLPPPSPNSPQPRPSRPAPPPGKPAPRPYTGQVSSVVGGSLPNLHLLSPLPQAGESPSRLSRVLGFLQEHYLENK